MKVVLIYDTVHKDELQAVCVVNNDTDLSMLENACHDAEWTMEVKTPDSLGDVIAFVKSEGESE